MLRFKENQKKEAKRKADEIAARTGCKKMLDLGEGGANHGLVIVTVTEAAVSTVLPTAKVRTSPAPTVMGVPEGIVLALIKLGGPALPL